MCVFQGIWSEMIHHGLWCQIVHWDWGLSAEMQLHSDNGISSCCDGQDWCWEEVTGRTLDDIHMGQAQEWGITIPAVAEFCSPFLYISQQSALVAIQNPMILVPQSFVPQPGQPQATAVTPWASSLSSSHVGYPLLTPLPLISQSKRTI